jgi:hypothetical protein
MQPKPNAETLKPLFPNSRVCKVVLLSLRLVRRNRSQTGLATGSWNLPISCLILLKITTGSGGRPWRVP